MQFFSDRRPCFDNAYCLPPPPQTQDVYGNAACASSGYACHPSRFDPQSQVNLAPTMPITPPPPYEAYQNTFDYGQQPSRAFYLQPYQSQHYLPVAAPPRPQARLRKKPSAWAWASTVQLSQTALSELYRQEQPWPSSVDLRAPPLPTRPDAIRHDCPLVQAMTQGTALCDRVASVAARVNDVFSRIDQEDRSDEELEGLTRGMTLKETGVKAQAKANSVVDFRKTWLYANSRLPPAMLPMKIYIPTWQIICAAAQTSVDVYLRPKRDEREDFVQAHWRQGTKAMVLKSNPLDDKNVIVLAIRGSKTWNMIDWMVNFNAAPTEPMGFLDDEGNACHAGFLQIARSMIAPVATRLQTLLEHNFSRGPPSLILTGHSAGGAIASLLYMHMMATNPRCETELNGLTGFFKRVHCVTFGAPPVSFLPLQNPLGKRYERNVFMHFANEGDVVVRADRTYMSTIVRLVAAPSPLSSSKPSNALRQKVSRQALKAGSLPGNKYRPPTWEVPPATLSSAGRMVLLREKPGSIHHTIEAVQVTDGDLRDRVFGDPEMHRMELYKRRIDQLAYAAVTGQGVG